jgi:hypothetical protein
VFTQAVAVTAGVSAALLLAAALVAFVVLRRAPQPEPTPAVVEG